MILYFTGVPGSGKTYYGVDYIHRTVLIDAQKEYRRKKKFNRKYIYLYLYAKQKGYESIKRFARRHLKKVKSYYGCYTNINGLKYEKLPRVHELNFNALNKSIKELYAVYKEHEDDKNLDDVLNHHAKMMGHYKTLYVIDEAHNIFDTRKAHLIWWLTYHRHMYQDIILITQNLSLVEPKYKRLAEVWYRAKPKSLSLFSHVFKYDAFTNPQLFKNSKAGTLKIKKSQKVFDLYQSGDSVDVENIILKFLKIGAVLVLLLAAYLYFVVFGSDDKETVEPVAQVHFVVPAAQKSKPSPPPTKREVPKERMFTFFLCDSNGCFVEGNYIPVFYMPELLGDYGYQVLYVKPVVRDYKQVYCLISPDFRNLFKKIVEPEKDEDSLSKEFSPFSAFQ